MTTEQVSALWGAGVPFASGTKGQLVTQLTQSVTGVVSAKDGNVFGETTVFIDGRRNEVRTQETTAGNLSADAILFVAQQVDPGVQVSQERWRHPRRDRRGGEQRRRDALAAAGSADAPQEQYWSRCSNGSVQGAETVV